MFFHFSNLPDGTMVEQGDRLRFTIQNDPRNGKLRAANIGLIDSGDNRGSSKAPAKSISMRAFSMNMPFAALLANGYKTLESRNGTMFQPYPEGTQMLLHVGHRLYPDGNRHLEIMRDQEGLPEEEIHRLKSLPAGFDKGTVVAILQIGKTYETTTQQRCEPAMQQKICAYGADSGRIVTEIAKVAYLKKPVSMAAQGGVFQVSIPSDVVPDGWGLSPGLLEPDAYEVQGRRSTEKRGEKSSNQPRYSISG